MFQRSILNGSKPRLTTGQRLASHALDAARHLGNRVQRDGFRWLAPFQMTRYVIRAPSREAKTRRASCEIAGRRFETQGPAPIYKITTLLWLHGHGGADFEIWDDLSPFGKPGGLAMRGRVQNWARLIYDKPNFGRGASMHPFAPSRKFQPAF